MKLFKGMLSFFKDYLSFRKTTEGLMRLGGIWCLRGSGGYQLTIRPSGSESRHAVVLV